MILYGVGTSRGTGEARQGGERSELPVLESVVATTSDTYAANRAASLELLAAHDRLVADGEGAADGRLREVQLELAADIAAGRGPARAAAEDAAAGAAEEGIEQVAERAELVEVRLVAA